MSIKIFKISYFSFTFKLNEKKKAPLKNIIWKEGEVTRKFSLEEGFKKKGAYQERDGEKVEGWPSKELWKIDFFSLQKVDQNIIKSNGKKGFKRNNFWIGKYTRQCYLIM